MAPLASTLRACAVSQITVQPLSFLWQGRLPFGKLAILDGDPGLGKSLVTLDLCARLSTGAPLPDGTPGPSPTNCIVINAEDGLEDTIVPRLKALGADLDRVFVLTADEDIDLLPLRLPSQMAALDRLLGETRAKLVVIDPIVAFLDPTVQLANDHSVRRALQPLAMLARKHQCVILLVRHLNKTGDQRALYRGGGSIAFVAACRTAWLIAEHPEHSGQRILAQNKNNVGPPQPSLAFELVRGDGHPSLCWLDGPCPLTADQLLVRAGRPPLMASALARACDFLTGLLEDAPRSAREVWAAAETEGLTERTLRRARKELDIRSRRVSVNGAAVSYWLLPGQQLPETIPADSIVPDLEPWLAPLREQFPASTPLDES
jgi:hypothetical protein